MTSHGRKDSLASTQSSVTCEQEPFLKTPTVSRLYALRARSLHVLMGSTKLTRSCSRRFKGNQKLKGRTFVRQSGLSAQLTIGSWLAKNPTENYPFDSGANRRVQYAWDEFSAGRFEGAKGRSSMSDPLRRWLRRRAKRGLGKNLRSILESFCVVIEGGA